MNDGGLVFPLDTRKTSEGSSGGTCITGTIYHGMSLRSHFAGQMLAAMLGNTAVCAMFSEQANHDPTITAANMSQRATEFADALIAKLQPDQ